MTRVKRVLHVLAGSVFLAMICAVLVAGMVLMVAPSGAVAQAPPTKEPADTPEPPTEEPPTAEPPTEEPPPTEEVPIEVPATAKPPTVKPPEKESESGPSEPNPNCQSVVEGQVVNASGQALAGATVTISGEGLSRQMLTDDQGHYGFGELCPGTLTLDAAQPGGKMSTPATLDVDGKSPYYLKLTIGSTVDSAPVMDVVATQAPTQQTPAPASEPNMPQTGFSGGLLFGGLLLVILAFLVVGTRRAMKTR